MHAGRNGMRDVSSAIRRKYRLRHGNYAIIPINK